MALGVRPTLPYLKKDAIFIHSVLGFVPNSPVPAFPHGHVHPATQNLRGTARAAFRSRKLSLTERWQMQTHRRLMAPLSGSGFDLWRFSPRSSGSGAREGVVHADNVALCCTDYRLRQAIVDRTCQWTMSMEHVRSNMQRHEYLTYTLLSTHFKASCLHYN